MAGPGKGNFSYQLLGVAREALLQHPDARVRSLQDVESVLQVRIVLGGPPSMGSIDPDKVGVKDWQLTLYCAGDAPTGGLEFIHFILQHKVQQNQLANLPDLQVHLASGEVAQFPEPWHVVDASRIEIPKPFAALPPRGRRHVIAQLELDVDEGSEDSGEGTRAGSQKYILTFFGGIYTFRPRFDDKKIPGAQMPTGDGEQRDYVRYVRFNSEAASMQLVVTVLQDVLLGLPVYFVNMAGEADGMATWLQDQPTIVQAEVRAEGP